VPVVGCVVAKLSKTSVVDCIGYHCVNKIEVKKVQPSFSQEEVDEKNLEIRGVGN
jgi:hypothetical protein